MKTFVSLLTVLALAGCATHGTPPPVIALDEPPVVAETVPVASPARAAGIDARLVPQQ